MYCAIKTKDIVKNVMEQGTHYLKNVPCRKCSVYRDKSNAEIMPYMIEAKIESSS